MEIIIGAAVSLAIQWLKQWSKSEWTTLFGVLVLSLAAAAGYTLLVQAGYWQTVAEILITAGAFYSYVIQRFE